MITMNLHTSLIQTVEHRHVEGTHWLHIQDEHSYASIHGDEKLARDLEAAFNAYLSRHGRLNLELTEKDTDK